MTKKGDFNNRVTFQSWWKNRNLLREYDWIIERTRYLDSSCNMTERIYHIYHDLWGIPDCKREDCVNKPNFNGFLSGYFDYCSSLCSTQCEKRNKKIVENIDYGKVQEKVKQTNLEKYGVEYYFQTEEAIKKIRETKLEKYGDDNYCNLEKIKQTNLEKYGVEYSWQAPEVIAKIQKKKTILYPQLRDKEWLRKENETKSITQISQELGCTYRTVFLWFERHNLEQNFFPHEWISQGKVEEFVRSIYLGEIISNDRSIISPKEIDILIPSKNIGIEYNGMYWHSGDKYRHKEKYLLCKEQGIRLLQFWDVEWNNQTDIVKSIIKTALGVSERIHARKTEIREVSNLDYRNFLNINHIQGYSVSPIRYGLYFNGELVSVVGFGKPRFTKEYDFELIRFANQLGYNVMGGFSKLLSHFGKNHSGSIQTFCDLRLFSGNVYESCGFSFSHYSDPGYVYYKRGMIKSRMYFQKHKLENIFENFDPNLTEEENLLRNGWVRVYDCGNSVYVLK